MIDFLKAIGLACSLSNPANLTPDGFAITRQKIMVNNHPLSDDDRPRYVTPDQRAMIGWCNLALLLAPMVIISSLIIIGRPTERRQVNMDNPFEIGLLIGLILTVFLNFYGFFIRFRIAMEVDCQIYDPSGE